LLCLFIFNLFHLILFFYIYFLLSLFSFYLFLLISIAFLLRVTIFVLLCLVSFLLHINNVIILINYNIFSGSYIKVITKDKIIDRIFLNILTPFV
jgi:hypothetical protein